MIINLTPHDVNIQLDDNFVKYPKAGSVARAKEFTEIVGTVDNVEIITRTYGELENLPGYEEGVYYIVSAMVRMAAPERKDLLSPGDLCRDKEGNITGCKNLVANW